MIIMQLIWRVNSLQKSYIPPPGENINKCLLSGPTTPNTTHLLKQQEHGSSCPRNGAVSYGLKMRENNRNSLESWYSALLTGLPYWRLSFYICKCFCLFSTEKYLRTGHFCLCLLRIGYSWEILFLTTIDSVLQCVCENMKTL